MQIQANGLAIEIDDQGPFQGPPVLLIMGLGMQLLGWPDELVADLVARGFRVLRLDNRDAGLSAGFDHLPPPRMLGAVLRHTMGLAVRSPYALPDMAADALGVLDALGIASAHVCGASMGGMIAQHLAASHPQRVKSLTLLMTTSGAPGLPQPRWPVRQALLGRPRSPAVADVVTHLEHVLRVIGSPGYPPDAGRQRQRLEASARRAWRPAGTSRQLLAIVADGDRSPLLGKILAPTEVLHGAADVLVPPGHGRDLATKIAGAALELVPGMGHDLPLALLPRVADAIARAVRRAGAG
jgi:pimeloyl-ACP methyl ester carboxylesterase